MNCIIFIAPPAAGKGTMSQLLEDKYHFVHISTGDLLRDAKIKNDELGKLIASCIDQGQLVSDEIVLELLQNRIQEPDCQKGFILDGYPRNLSQANKLLEILNNLQITNYQAIYLDIDYEKAMKRTLGRLTCQNCKRGYNLYFTAMQPKVKNICDNCGHELTRRLDDTEATFKVRFDTYLKETSPVIHFFEEKGKLSTIKVIDNPQTMLSQIERIIEK